jgi:hypothetical protein
VESVVTTSGWVELRLVMWLPCAYAWNLQCDCCPKIVFLYLGMQCEDLEVVCVRRMTTLRNALANREVHHDQIRKMLCAQSSHELTLCFLQPSHGYESYESRLTRRILYHWLLATHQQRRDWCLGGVERYRRNRPHSQFHKTFPKPSIKSIFGYL